MRYALVPRFHLEMALMKLVYARRLTSIESLLGGLGGSGLAQKTPPARAPLPPLPRAPLPNHRARCAPRVSRGREKRPPHLPAKCARPLPPRPAPRPLKRRAGQRRPAPCQHQDDGLWPIKFPGYCLEHMSGWRCEDGVVEFQYDPKDSFFADLLKSREQAEILRTVCSQVWASP